MLNNKKISMLVALILAAALWFYVVYDVNPASSGSIRNIPISIVNEQYLEDNGLCILDMDYETVNISIEGQRSDVVSAKADRFKATIDLDGVIEGANEVRVVVTGPNNLRIVTQSITKVIVNVDKYIEMKKDISVKITNQTSDDSEPYIVQISQKDVLVSGPEELVFNVDHVSAVVDSEKVGSEMKAITAELIPETAEGERVEGITLSDNTISVTAVMLNKKTVPLEVPITGNDSSFIGRNIEVPKAITIKGTDANLSQVNKVVCEEIDASKIFENTVISLVPILPSGIEVATDSSELTAKVNVFGASTKTINFTAKDVVVEGALEGFTASVEEADIGLTVICDATLAPNLTSEDFSLVLKLPEGEELKEGEYELDLNISSDLTILEYHYQPEKLKVMLSKIQEVE